MEKELLNKIRDAYEAESNELGPLLKQAGFSDDQLNKLRDAYEAEDDVAFGAIIKTGPLSTKEKSEREKLGLTREEFAKKVQDESRKEIVEARQKEQSKGFKATFPRLAQSQAQDEGYLSQAGATFLDTESLIPRASLAGAEGAGALAAESYTGGELPIGDIMLESFGRTEGTSEMGLAESMGEGILRDPLTYIPGISSLKRVKDLGTLAKLGALGAYEAGLEGFSQLVDPTKEFNPLTMGLGAATPGIGEGLQQLGKQAARAKYGSVGEGMLEAGLIKDLSNTEKATEDFIAQGLQTKKANVDRLTGIDDLTPEFDAADDMLKHGMIDETEYNDYLLDIVDHVKSGNQVISDEIFNNAMLKAEKDYSLGLIDNKQLEAIRKQISIEMEDASARRLSGDIEASNEALMNRVQTWHSGSKGKSNKALVNRYLYESSIEPTTRDFMDIPEFDLMHSLQQSQLYPKRRTPTYDMLGRLGDIMQSDITSSNLYRAGELSQMPFRVVPESYKELGDIMSE